MPQGDAGFTVEEGDVAVELQELPPDGLAGTSNRTDRRPFRKCSRTISSRSASFATRYSTLSAGPAGARSGPPRPALTRPKQLACVMRNLLGGQPAARSFSARYLGEGAVRRAIRSGCCRR